MSEFAALAMNDTAIEKCRVIREAFSEALTAIKQRVGLIRGDVLRSTAFPFGMQPPIVSTVDAAGCVNACETYKARFLSQTGIPH